MLGALLLFPEQLTLIPELRDMKVSLLSHFPAIHPAYYLRREPDKERQNMKESEDQRDRSQWNRG